jgi:hypothetical protein
MERIASVLIRNKLLNDLQSKIILKPRNLESRYGISEIRLRNVQNSLNKFVST